MSNVLPLRDPDFWQDPFPLINRLREAARVAHTDDGVKVILRHADVEALLNGGQFINEGISLLERRGFKPGDPIHEWRRQALGSLHGENHRRIRSLVGKAMGERYMESIPPAVEHYLWRILDEVGGERFDAVTAIGAQLPLQVISEYLGIAPQDRQRVDHLVRQGQAEAFGVNVTPEIRERVNAMFAILLEFIEGLIDERRISPGNDLLTQLLDVDEMGDRLSKPEIVVLFLNLFIGATESTASAMTTGLWQLALRPSLLRQLRRDPSLIENFVEEVLRLFPPNTVLGNKIAARDTEFCGVPFAEGEMVVVPLASPNRDPRVFERPDEIDLQRPRKRHFTFSYGAHFCLGQALARCQLRAFFEVVARHCDRIELLTDTPRWVPFTAINRMEALPLRFPV